MFGIFKRKAETKVRKVVRQNIVKLGRSSFDAAQVNNLFSEWETISQPINQQLESDLRAMRARSRNLAKNNPYMRRFFQLCRTNIVGSGGMVLKSQALQDNGSPAKIDRQAIEKAWKEFSKKGVCCAVDKMTMKDLDNMSVNQLMGDGEIIIWCQEGIDQGPFGIKFKFIDPELMDVNHKEKRGGNSIRMGVETDPSGRVVAYHFHSTDSTNADYYQTGGRGYVRVEKRHIIHEFIFDYVDQLRGYPAMVAAMARLRMLDGYDESVLVAARVAASSMGFIERGENGEGFEANMKVDDEDEDFVESEDPEIESEPGSWHYVDHGSKIHDWSPKQPTTAYKDFVKTILRSIASALGVDYNTLANDLEGVNFSSLRGGVLESREFWKVIQEWMIEHVKAEIFERWLRAALLRGAIKWPRGDKKLMSQDIDRLKAHTFQARRWAWVDPLKDLQAAKLGIDEGLISRSEVMREQGRDPEQVWEEMAREKEQMEKLGITVNSKPTESSVSSNTENESDEGVENAENEESDGAE